MQAVVPRPLARTTTFVEATQYLMARVSDAPGTMSVAPILEADWLQYVRDVAEKVVPTAGRHRDHYTVSYDGFLLGYIVTTRDDAGLLILDAIVAVPF